MSERDRKLDALKEMYGNPSVEELEEELRERREYRENIRAIRSAPQRLFDAMNARKEALQEEELPMPSRRTKSLLDTISQRSEPSDGFSAADRAAITIERGKDSADKAERNWHMRNRPGEQAGSKGWDEYLPDHPKLQARARERAIQRAELAREKHKGSEAMAGLFREHALDEDGNIDPERLAAAPYPVRAWYEKHRVVSGVTKERQGGVRGSDWYETLGASAKRRYDRLVKVSHFGTRGRAMVAPHPTNEGYFILIDEDGDRIENPDLHGRMDKIRRREQNQRNIDENPEYYAKAFQRRRDRERTLDARREMRRGNRHKAISINMNLPMDHPAVIDAVRHPTHGMPKGRYWQGNPNRPIALTGGPSDSAAYWADYYDPGEVQGGRGGSGRGSSSSQYKPPESYRRPWEPASPGEAVVQQGVTNSLDKIKAIDAALLEETDPLRKQSLEGQRVQAQEEYRQATVEFERRGMEGTPRIPPQGGGAPGVSSWGPPPQREDIRGKNFFGHYDHRYGGGDPTDAWAQLSPAQDGAGSDLHEQYKDWTNWLSPEERAALAEAEAEALRERQAQRQAEQAQQQGAQQQAQQSPGGTFDPGAGQGLSPPRRPMEGTPEPPQPGQRPPDPPTGAYQGDVQDVTPSKMVTDGRSREIPEAELPPPPPVSQGQQQWATAKRNEFRPVGQGKDPGQLMANPSMIEPYQPTMSQSGRWQWEQVSKDQWWKDYSFDKNFGLQLWDIKNGLDSQNLSAGGRQDKVWYSMFMQQARKVVAPHYTPQGGEARPEIITEIDHQIHRWGDRHMTSSSYWNSNSPSVLRGRKFDEPPVTLPGALVDQTQSVMGWGGPKDDWSSVRHPYRGKPGSLDRFGNMLEFGWDVLRRPFEGVGETIFNSDTKQHERRKRNIVNW